MKPTPQQLMDLPFAGMVEKQLRKDGRWVDMIATDESPIKLVIGFENGYSIHDNNNVIYLFAH